MVRMLKTVISVISTIALWLWVGARLAMDAVGRSTVYEDSQNALGLVERGLNWLFQTPAWVPGVLAALLTLFVSWTFWPHRYIRPSPPHTDTSKQESVRIPANRPSSVKLQFRANDHNVRQISEENIRSVYANKQVARAIFPSDPARDKEIIKWIVFIVFAEPTVFGQIHVDGNGAPFPSYTMLSYNPWSVVIQFDGDFGGAQIDIRFGA